MWIWCVLWGIERVDFRRVDIIGRGSTGSILDGSGLAQYESRMIEKMNDTFWQASRLTFGVAETFGNGFSADEARDRWREHDRQV